MPNPMSWYIHHFPKWFHRGSVVANHFVQLIVPWGLFLPQPISSIAGALIILSQTWLMVTGNFSWLNLITIALALSSFSDNILNFVLPGNYTFPIEANFVLDSASVILLIGVIFLSIPPVLNLISPRQLMNYSFTPLHLVNTYGAFGSITKKRFEIILEGTEDSALTATTLWKEYEFKGKPGDPRRRPQQFAPYHLRLDWLMWFAAMSSYVYHPWFMPLIEKLLQNDPQILKLLKHNPFQVNPPRFIRARLYHYRFTNPKERHTMKQWWMRTFVGDYTPIMGDKKVKG